MYIHIATFVTMTYILQGRCSERHYLSTKVIICEHHFTSCTVSWKQPMLWNVDHPSPRTFTIYGNTNRATCTLPMTMHIQHVHHTVVIPYSGNLSRVQTFVKISPNAPEETFTVFTFARAQRSTPQRDGALKLSQFLFSR